MLVAPTAANPVAVTPTGCLLMNAPIHLSPLPMFLTKVDRAAAERAMSEANRPLNCRDRHTVDLTTSQTKPRVAALPNPTPINEAFSGFAATHVEP